MGKRRRKDSVMLLFGKECPSAYGLGSLGGWREVCVVSGVQSRGRVFLCEFGDFGDAF